MTRGALSTTAILSLFVMAAAASIAAAAGPQTPGSSPARTEAAQPGPLVLEPIPSGFVFTPELRLTRIDRWSATQLGGFGGWLVSDVFLLGAGGYGIASGPHGIGLHYGGMVAGISLPIDDRLRIGVRGLFGFGEAQLVERLPVMCPNPSVDFAPCFGAVRVHQNFAVFEPQFTLGARLGEKVTFELSGGYRVIGSADGREGCLQSGFGSVGLRFGPF